MQQHTDLENKSMKAFASSALMLALAACATTSQPSIDTTSDYTANRLPDGSVELIVTGTTAAPTRSRNATLELGAMLEEAAAKECPAGYDLSQDPTPSVREGSGKLVATLRGVARCK